MQTKTKDCLKQCIEYDEARDSAPGEHLMTAATGIALIFSALGTRYKAVAVLKGVAAGMLLWRAASGRDGLRKWVGAGPLAPPVVIQRVRPD